MFARILPKIAVVLMAIGLIASCAGRFRASLWGWSSLEENLTSGARRSRIQARGNPWKSS